MHRLKRCVHNNKDKDNSPNALNDKNAVKYFRFNVHYFVGSSFGFLSQTKKKKLGFEIKNKLYKNSMFYFISML